ncbi:MAG: translation initiation factor IF-3 [Bacteroidetes bacterium]|nr:MAG: translation initiation factor IF-3 [Bacteroidota bacterium]
MAGNYPRRPRFPQRDRGPEHKINDKIRASKVRIVGDNVGEPRVVSLEEALEVARRQDLDLVLIVENADPPVCRVVDYQKFLYQKKRKEKEQKAKTTKVVLKEIRFGPNTDDHDYDFKLRHAQKFLQDGAKVKALVFFKGRSIVFQDQGEMLLLRFAKDLEDLAKVEQLPKLEGKRMIMFLAPLNAGKKK